MVYPSLVYIIVPLVLILIWHVRNHENMGKCLVARMSMNYALKSLNEEAY